MQNSATCCRWRATHKQDDAMLQVISVFMYYYTNASYGVRHTQYHATLQVISVDQYSYSNAYDGLRRTQYDAMLQVISVVHPAYTNASYGVRHSHNMMRRHPNENGYLRSPPFSCMYVCMYARM